MISRERLITFMRARRALLLARTLRALLLVRALSLGLLGGGGDASRGRHRGRALSEASVADGKITVQPEID